MTGDYASDYSDYAPVAPIQAAGVPFSPFFDIVPENEMQNNW